MYCPKCGAEYRPGFTKCADCDVALAGEPPIQSDPDEIDFVKLLKTGDFLRVRIIKTLLDDAGINNFITRGKTHNIYGFGRPETSYEVRIPENDVLKAREILIKVTGRNERNIAEEEISEGSSSKENDIKLAHSLFDSGTQLYEKGLLSEAEYKLGEAREILPGSFEIGYNLALVYLAQKKYYLVRELIGKLGEENCPDIVNELNKQENRQQQVYENYCPKCKYYRARSGRCRKIFKNIRRNPESFTQKCNGTLFKPGLEL